MLDLDPDAAVAHERIRVRMDIDADCSDEELDALLTFVHAHSPVSNTITRPVTVTLERAGR